MSRCSHKGETYWNNHWIFMNCIVDIVPAIQHIVSKHYRKTRWFGRLLFYRHGISTPCLTNIVKALKEYLEGEFRSCRYIKQSYWQIRLYEPGDVIVTCLYVAVVLLCASLKGVCWETNSPAYRREILLNHESQRSEILSDVSLNYCSSVEIFSIVCRLS